MNLKEAAALAALVVSARPEYQKHNLEPTAHMWARLFANIPYSTMEAAVTRVLLTQEIGWPSPAAIMAAIDEIERLTDPNPPPTAGQAWEYTLKRIGSSDPPDWPHPYVKEAVEAVGGLRAIGLNEEGDGTMRAHFFRNYEAICRRARTEQINRQVIAVLGMDFKQVMGGGFSRVALCQGTGGRRGADPVDAQPGEGDARASNQGPARKAQ